MKINIFLVSSMALLSLSLLACSKFKAAGIHQKKTSVTVLHLSDPHATAETQALYKNLQNLKHHHILFGQQDTLAYGFKWDGSDSNATASRADAKDTTGSFVALTGWDLGGLELGNTKNIDGVNFEKMRAGIRSVYQRGGVNTLSWHISNPLTGGNHADKTPAVQEILPGGSKHEQFKANLDAFVAFNENLKMGNVYIPIIFRPWHEHNGEWFWWGKGNVSEENYIALWRFTVDYLRNTKNVHNLIFALSPDRSRLDMKNFTKNYLYAYPGDAYVDVLGLDDYWDLGHPANKASTEEQSKNFTQSLTQVVALANVHHKLPALTECGSESITNPQFWTKVLLKGVKANKFSEQIAYLFVWRNATNGGYNQHHFYVPYPGHPSAEDFIKFKQDEFVLFEDELPAMYK